MNLIGSLLLFILSIGLISWSADLVIDKLKEIGEKFHIGGVALGFLILGIDLEESIASWGGSIAGLPEIALGNVIGNSLISISICFALPGLFFVLRFDEISAKYFWFIFGLAGINCLAATLPRYMLLWGILGLAIFAGYTMWNFSIISAPSDITGNKGAEPKGAEPKGAEPKGADNAGELGPELRNIDKAQRSLIKLTIWGVVGLLILILGSHFLIQSIEGLLLSTHLSEAVMGAVILAAATNVEEYFLLFSSLRKNTPELGIAALLGKVLWNLGATFGVSAVILGAKPTIFSISPSLIFLNLLFMLLVVPLLLYFSLHRKKIGKMESLAFLICFGLYLWIAVAV